MRLAQRIKKLEGTLGRWKEPSVKAPEIERTDEEWADWIGDFLWWPKGADMDHWPGYFASAGQASAEHSDNPLAAWRQAARLAWQQGHRDYHVGLRPYALAVWLRWKPNILEHRRTAWRMALGCSPPPPHHDEGRIRAANASGEIHVTPQGVWRRTLVEGSCLVGDTASSNRAVSEST